MRTNRSLEAIRFVEIISPHSAREPKAMPIGSAWALSRSSSSSSVRGRSAKTASPVA
jgi:hypothetical protein